MTRRLLVCWSTALALTPVLTGPAPLPPDDSWMNCFAVVAGKGCTEDGSVVFAHNEDSGHENPVHFHVVAPATHEKGAMRKLVNGGEEPFAEQTLGYLWCQMPGLRYSDTCFNEKGVAVATNGCHSRENAPDLTDGGITYMLRHIVAARAMTARHGVEVAGRLLDKFGYGATGRTMTIADRDEAWLINMAHGKQWVAARVPDDCCATIANHFSIHEVDLDDPKNFRASKGLIEHAVKRGWYDPKKDGPFDFATVYGTDGARKHRSNIRRTWRANNLIGDKPLEETWRQPTFIKVKRKLALKDFMRVLRDHLEGSEYDKSEGYTKCSPYDMKQPMICAGNTTFSTVFQLRHGDLPRAVGCVMWVSMSRPDASPFVPWYAGMLRVPKGLALKGAAESLRRHFAADFKKLGSPEHVKTAQQMQVALRPHFGSFFPRLKKERDHFETQLLHAAHAVEKDATRIFKGNDRAARELVTGLSHQLQKQANALVRRWSDELQKHIATKGQNKDSNGGR